MRQSYAASRRRPLYAMLGAALLAASSLLIANPAAAASITQVSSFGSNPGNVKMYKYVPANMPANAPLMVVIHGCTQTAQAYADQSGWHKYADAWKFYLVFPEQQSSNNQNSCWNFFESSDYQRGFGEALSIKQMVDNMKANHSIDGSRVFVTGLSSGGAFTNVMLATYPDVFKGGAPIAGIPYKCANGMVDAFSCMSPGVDKSPQQWGDLIRNAYSTFSGPYPKVSVWQGDQDTTVKPVNATETVEGWANVNGVDLTPDVQDTVAGYPHKAYKDANGDPRVELYTITGMAHGTPLDPGTAEQQCGTAGAYMLDVDICSSYYIGKFLGLDNSDQEAPTVSLTAPADGATVSGSVTISASALDNIGVARVDFYVDGKLFKSDNAAPYSVSWDSASAANGTHYIQAKGYDAANNVGSSAQIAVTVTGGIEDTTAPTASLTFPTSGSTVFGTVTLAAEANDDFGVTKLEFFVDGVSVGTGNQSMEAGPYTLSWNSTTVADGSHSVQAKAYDAKGNVGASASVGIIVNQNVLALDESFSDKDGNGDYFDTSGWSGSYTASADNHTMSPAGSSAAYGYASSGISCAGGVKTKTLSKNISLGDNPKLSYWRKLDLRAQVNSFTSAGFKATVNGTVVDEKSVTYANYTDSTWIERSGIDLSAFANQTVTLAFESHADSNVCMEVIGKAWVDDIQVGNPQEDADTTAPTVNLSAPTDGAMVSGTVDLTATASDAGGVNKVEFYINGSLAGADSTSPYGYTWNTLDVQNGDYQLMAKAYDAAGNVGSDNDTTVTVSNGGSGGGDGGGSVTSATFANDDAYDGYVKANADGSSAAVGAYESWYGLAAGRGSDGKYNRTLLSFDTSAIPDTATVTKAYVTLLYRSASGDPWADPTGNTLVIDVKSGCFGGCTIEAADFSATASASSAANVVKFTSGTQNSGNFNAAGLGAINKTGTTQLRLRFEQNPSSTNYIWVDNGVDAKLTVEYE